MFLLVLVIMHACVIVSLHVLFLLVFVCFCVSFELNWVLLFRGHLKFLNFKFVNHHLGYLGICLI